MLKTLLALSLLFSFFHASAKDFSKVFVRFKAECKAQGVTFLLTSDTKTMDDEEKSFGQENLWLQIGKETILVPFKSNSWSFAKQAKTGACGKAGGYVSGNVLAFAVQRNNRPMSDKLGVVFFDFKTKKLLAFDDSLGDLYDLDNEKGPTVKGAKGGIKFKAWMPRTDGTGYSVKLRGTECPVEEQDFTYWRLVQLSADNKIKNVIDRKETWKRSEFSTYFKTQKEFEKAYGLKGDDSEFTKDNVTLVASVPGSKTKCVLPTKNRSNVTDEKAWFCKD